MIFSIFFPTDLFPSTDLNRRYFLPFFDPSYFFFVYILRFEPFCSGSGRGLLDHLADLMQPPPLPRRRRALGSLLAFLHEFVEMKGSPTALFPARFDFPSARRSGFRPPFDWFFRWLRSNRLPRLLLSPPSVKSCFKGLRPLCFPLPLENDPLPALSA